MKIRVQAQEELDTDLETQSNTCVNNCVLLYLLIYLPTLRTIDNINHNQLFPLTI